MSALTLSQRLRQHLSTLRVVARTQALLLILVLVSLLFRVWWLGTLVEDRDSLFFSRGLERYSLMSMQPHWPGYPVYIGLGKLLHLVVPDPVRALHLLSAFASSLTTLPLAGLARGWRRANGGSEAQANKAGLLAALAWTAVPLSWIDGTEVFCDPTALLLATTMLWLAWRSFEASPVQGWKWTLAACCTAGLVAGTRLSYVALLLPAAYAAYHHRAAFGKRWVVPLFPLAALGSFLLVVGLWFGCQLALEGKLYFEAARLHLSGHFGGWGGSLLTDKHLAGRPLRFLETLLVYGLGGWWPGTPWLRLLATPLWLLTGVLGARALLRSQSRTALFQALLWTIPYTLWIAFGHDVDLARYHFPLVALLCILAGLGFPWDQKGLRVLCAGSLVALAAVTFPLAWEHRTAVALEVQEVEFFRQLPPERRPALLTDHNTIMLKALAPELLCIPVHPERLADQVTDAVRRGRRVFAPAHVLDPELAQGEQWSPVVRFCRNRFLHSRGHSEITLLELKQGGARATAQPDCFLVPERKGQDR